MENEETKIKMLRLAFFILIVGITTITLISELT
jgi:hypothetical protein